MVEDWTDREIIVIYDRSKEQALAGTKELPPRRFNMSGCSGGPVILHEYRGGLFRWYPVGVINRGPGDDANADIGVDVIRVRRINLLTEEGRINRPTSGWLPT